MPQILKSAPSPEGATAGSFESLARSPARIGQIVLGLFWCVDGLLKLQPYFFHSFVSGVIDPNAVGQPAVIGHPITWLASLIRPHQALFVIAGVLTEVSIGIALMVRRTVKPALLVSFAWALVVWLTGEGLGALFTGTTPDPLTGILGTAPLYIFAGLLVWPRQPGDRNPGLGLLGERTARVIFAGFWLGAAVLWLFPANAAANALSTAFTGAPSGASWLTGLHSDAAQAVGGSGMTIALILAVISAEIGFSVLSERATRAALLVSIALSLAFWILAEGLGGLFTGQATDVGTGPLMILIATLLLLVVPQPDRVTQPRPQPLHAIQP